MQDTGAGRLRLWPLAAANFVVGMGAFVAVGILTPVAGAFGIDPAQAGWVMTAYALVYAPTSPLLVALTGALDRRLIVTGGLAIFALGSLAAALAPGFAALLAARAVMAVGGGLVTPVCAAIAVGASAPADRGRALAAVFSGLTLAQVLGVPAGAWLGYTFGWQAAFAAVAVLGAAAVAVLWRTLPAGIAGPRASLAALGATLGSGWRMLAVGFGVFFLGGIYCVYTYFGPLMEARLGLGRDGVSAMLLLFGLGAVAGNWIGGRMADRLGPDWTLLILSLAQVPILAVLTALPMPLPATAALVLGWSLCGWSFMAPQQARLASLDPGRAPVLLSLNAAAIYLAASVGALAGGAALQAGGGFWATGAAAALFLLAGAASLALVPRLRRAAGE